jgi:hypothetical protein
MVLVWLELARQTGPFFSGADAAVPIPVSDNRVYQELTSDKAESRGSGTRIMIKLLLVRPVGYAFHKPLRAASSADGVPAHLK